jgi:hypothetical protein
MLLFYPWRPLASRDSLTQHASVGTPQTNSPTPGMGAFAPPRSPELPRASGEKASRLPEIVPDLLRRTPEGQLGLSLVAFALKTPSQRRGVGGHGRIACITGPRCWQEGLWVSKPVLLVTPATCRARRYQASPALASPHMCL